MAVLSVPIDTNEQLRESRLFKSMSGFIRRSASTMVRVYTTHEPLKVFLTAAFFTFLASMIPFGRFMYFYFSGQAGGHVQSLIFGLVLFFASGFLATVGILAELISSNRKLIEEVLKIIRDQRKAG